MRALAAVLAIIVLVGTGSMARAANPTIDVMYVAPFGNYAQTYSPSGEELQLPCLADYYVLNNGSSWDSGAGSYHRYYSGLASANVTGDTIQYTLDLPVSHLFYNQTDYDSGYHSAQGELASTAPLVLQARIGSTAATLAGHAAVVSNVMTSYGPQLFNFYSANVGDWVPFTATYTLLSGQTWQPDTFSKPFYYTMVGNVNFAQALPEPATVTLLALGGLLIARRRATRLLPILLAGCLLFGSTGLAPADVFNLGGTRNPATGQWTGSASLEFVTVGDPGNAAHYDAGDGARGAVSYTYQIGKYDVTAAQYCQFLNAVAKTDSYGLYSTCMASPRNLGTTFGITQSGNSGSYTYSVTGNPNFPMNWITWGDAARFCNWLSNRQPTGLQGAGTTETGSYTLNGATSNAALMAITRNPGATYVIPTADEWYKAAYYKGSGTNAGYWFYPTRSNNYPSNVLSSTGTNNANCYNNNYTDPVNKLTPVGCFAGSPSPYGTFDQGGNVWQWNERIYYNGLARGLRGASLIYPADSLAVWTWNNYYPAESLDTIGFRIALVPEPATVSPLVLGGLLIARRRRAKHILPVLVAVGSLAGLMNPASADVFNMGGTRDPVTGQWTGSASLEFVTVGDPGNNSDPLASHGHRGWVPYSYQIGKYDVTAGQYCQFLNAVARSDLYGLYNADMANPAYRYYGCGIIRSGQEGSYTYSVMAGRENFPVNHVSWGDAARFCNWLSNGRPTGLQAAGTTETGSYTLNGAMANAQLLAIERNPGATYAIPSEDEWYKAAYYKGGGTHAGYWLYPTRSDSVPSNVLSSTGTNNANFVDLNGTPGNYTYTYTDPQNYITPVGAFAASPGPYGTFDTGGNVSQWTEGIWSGARILRGASFGNNSVCLEANTWASGNGESGSTGFRVALVPEPATLSLLALSGLLIARRRRVRQAN